MSKILTAIVIIIANLATPAAALQTAPIAGSARTEPIQHIVIHATGGPDCNAKRSFRSGTLAGIIQYFTDNQHRISIHYIIDRNGDVVRMVPEQQIAHHVRGHNANSIGIELINDGDGHDQFAAAQITALIALLRELLPRYQLTAAALKSHAELDDSWLDCGKQRIKRKQDPGAAFPWQQVKQELTAPAAPVIAIPPPLPAPPPPVVIPPELKSPLFAVRQRQQHINALVAVDREFRQRERVVNANLSLVFNDRQDAAIALATPGDEDRQAQLQETLTQLNQREVELRRELLGILQVQENAKAAIRHLRNIH